MKREDRTQRELAAVAACRDDPTAPEATPVLRAALERGVSFVVAAAAKLVGEAELEALASLLAPAYLRVADHDPGCHAKLAVVEALVRLEVPAGDLLLAAASCRQLEKAWGPPVDTAAALRGHAAVGLASAAHPEAGVVIARLLADPEWTARCGAARAAGRLPVDVALPLLVLKVTQGDPQPEVLGDCFRSLLEVAPERMIGPVSERLEGAEEVAEQAALALGESRLEGAFAPLRDYADRAAGTGTRRRAVLVALAILRRDEANAYLLGLIRDAPRRTAALAVEALAIHKHDPRLRDAALAAVRARDDTALAEKAAQAFADAEPD
jgi:hypothetical protein